MTEKKKRFTKCDDGTFCLLDNGKGLEYDEVIDLFNELHEENDELKQRLQTRHIVNKQYEELQQLKKENERLRKDREDLFYRERDTKNEWRELHIENKIFRKFIELNDFDPDEIIRQGKGIE